MALRGKFQRPQNRPATIEYTEKGLSKLCCKTQRNLESPLFHSFSSSCVPEKAFSVCIKDSAFIGPPYNTGNDFIYADDFMRSQEEENEQMGMYDEDKNRLFKNIDTNGRFHSDWCSMIYSRLMLARNLLTDDGVIFISIDDGEVGNLRKICDEVFSANNFLANLI